MRFNSCFSVPLLVNALIAENLTPIFDQFLTSLCAESTPECPLDWRKQAEADVWKGCSDEYPGNPGGVPALNYLTITNYEEIKGALCSKNLKCVEKTSH